MMLNQVSKEKKLMSKKIFLSTKSKTHLPKYYYRLLMESENKYYQMPNNSNLNYLIYLYKIAIEFFSINNISKVSPFLSKLSLISSNHEKLLLRYNYISLINKVKFLIEKTNTQKYNEKLEKNCIKLAKKKVIKFQKKMKIANLYINSYLQEQNDNFYKKYKIKILNLLINKKFIPDDSKIIKFKQDLNYENNKDCEKKGHQKFNTTKDLSSIPIQQIFFDEDENYIKRQIQKIKKKQNFKLNELINKNFTQFLSVYKYFNASQLEKLINVIDDYYNKKKDKYIEFSENIKNYGALSEMNTDNNQFELLINSLKEDYEIEISDLDNKLNKKILECKNNEILENKTINLIIEDFITQIIDNLFEKKYE